MQHSRLQLNSKRYLIIATGPVLKLAMWDCIHSNFELTVVKQIFVYALLQCKQSFYRTLLVHKT
ncbi:hypothetical protein ATS76_06750 [Pseudoalteromonas sp. 10-33]|nr:hypothetical protein ATS76_06750 [Pseudoalteromonas sp. 10-33]